MRHACVSEPAPHPEEDGSTSRQHGSRGLSVMEMSSCPVPYRSHRPHVPWSTGRTASETREGKCSCYSTSVNCGSGHRTGRCSFGTALPKGQTPPSTGQTQLEVGADHSVGNCAFFSRLAPTLGFQQGEGVHWGRQVLTALLMMAHQPFQRREIRNRRTCSRSGQLASTKGRVRYCYYLSLFVRPPSIRGKRNWCFHFCS